MALPRRHLYGEHPRRAAATVAAVGCGAAAVLAPFGLLERGVSGPLGWLAFTIAFCALPGLAGGVCGVDRLGLPAAIASGLAPGVAFYLVVAVGAALGIGSFGGGDSPLGPFALALTAPGVVLATATFAVVALTTRQRE